MKAEDKLMGDVASLLDNVTSIGSVSGSFKSTKAKQDLVQILIENERSRLRVWLFPLLQERKHYLPGYGGKSGSEVSCICQALWLDYLILEAGCYLFLTAGVGRESELSCPVGFSVPICKTEKRCSLAAPELPREGSGGAC